MVQSTWEGSNGVLIQQTAKFLLTQFSKYIQKGTIAIESFVFLKEMEDDNETERILTESVNKINRFDIELWMKDFQGQFSGIIKLFQYRLKLMGELVAESFAIHFEKQKDLFSAFNSTLPDGLLKASKHYGEYETLLALQQLVLKNETVKEEKEIEFFKKLSICYIMQRLI